MKPFVLPEMIPTGHSKSPAVSSFVRSPGLSTTDRKSKLHLFSDRNALSDLEGRLRSLAMAQPNRPHTLC